MRLSVIVIGLILSLILISLGMMGKQFLISNEESHKLILPQVEIVNETKVADVEDDSKSEKKITPDMLFEKSENANTGERYRGIINDTPLEESKTEERNRTRKTLIIEVAPIDVIYEDQKTDHIDKKFLELINEPAGYTVIQAAGGQELKFISLYGIDDWFKKEHKRITGVDKEIFDIQIRGPFMVDHLPPRRWINDPCEVLKPYFLKIATEHEINTNLYDVVSFIFFDDGNRSPNLAEPLFWSCASGNTTSFSFVNVSTSYAGINKGVIQVAHELFHSLGAYDAYTGWRCTEPDGIPEPYKQPKYPQTNACLMCINIMISETSMRSPNSIEEEMICDMQAKAAGWIAF